jgi:hypothetical protein
MSMRRTDTLHPFRHQAPIGPPKPFARPNARASEADIRSQTGKSGPANAPGHHHVHYHAHGDHRQANLHTGRENSSAVPRVETAGQRVQIPPSSRGDFDGNDAA